MRIQDEKDLLVDYQIRDVKLGYEECFEVSKWSGGRVPETVYTVHQRGSKFTCTCPAAFRGNCKHITMVQSYLAQGRPATFKSLESEEFLK